MTGDADIPDCRRYDEGPPGSALPRTNGRPQKTNPTSRSYRPRGDTVMRNKANSRTAYPAKQSQPRQAELVAQCPEGIRPDARYCVSTGRHRERGQLCQTKPTSRAGDDPSCETKPIEAAVAVCSGPARASKGTPCGVTANRADPAKQTQFPALLSGAEGLSAKQSQFPDGPPCETKPIEAAGTVCSGPARASEETPCGVTTNGSIAPNKANLERAD